MPVFMSTELHTCVFICLPNVVPEIVNLNSSFQLSIFTCGGWKGAITLSAVNCRTHNIDGNFIKLHCMKERLPY